MDTVCNFAAPEITEEFNEKLEAMVLQRVKDKVRLSAGEFEFESGGKTYRMSSMDFLHLLESWSTTRARPVSSCGFSGFIF